jgi:transposase
MAGRPEVASVVGPLLTVWRTVRDQIAGLDRQIMTAAKEDPTCRLLMTCPGVGAVIAMSFSAAVEALGHFRRSRSVGAYLGMTPRRHQSGEIDHNAGVSKRGDRLLRSYLFEAAACLVLKFLREPSLLRQGVPLASSGALHFSEASPA